VERHVSGRGDRPDAVGDFAFAIGEDERFRLAQWLVVEREVARRGALVRVRGVTILAALNQIPRLRKTGPHDTLRVAVGVSAGVIEVKMRVDDECDVLRRYAELREAVLECRPTIRALVLDAVDVVELFRLLVSGASVDEDQTGLVLDQQTAHAQLNPVPLVGRDAALPEWLRDDTEHRAAVQPLASGLDGMDAQGAECARLNERLGRHERQAVGGRRWAVGDVDGRVQMLR